MMNSNQAGSMGLESQQSAATNLHSKNLAETLKEEQLTSIGADCKTGFEEDLSSRSEWEDNIDQWVALAKQVQEEKTYPWPGASNVKYPLVSTAALQFAARSYPSLIPADGKVVNAQVVGKDPTGEKFEKAQRVGLYMSYQIMQEMRGWEEDMDKMLMQLPIVGTMFKKTYYDKSDDQIKSCVILPKNLVVNYWTTCLEEAERVSEIIYISARKLKEKQNNNELK